MGGEVKNRKEGRRDLEAQGSAEKGSAGRGRGRGLETVKNIIITVSVEMKPDLEKL